ncbi:MAG: DoxX family protein [Myxococcales bacterium]|nr:DoxX family protein [Myxococcales bacterium]
MRDDLLKLLLRCTPALLMLPHGIAKLSKGVGGIAERLEDAGLPGFIAYGVYVGEIVAPIFMVLGFKARAAAAVFAFNMVVAVALVHAGDVFKLGKGGSWALEPHALYFFFAVAVVLAGSGRYSVSKGQGRLD